MAGSDTLPTSTKEEHRLDGALGYNSNRMEVLITEISSLAEKLVPVRLVREGIVDAAPKSETDASEIVGQIYDLGRRIDYGIEVVKEVIQDLEI